MEIQNPNVIDVFEKNILYAKAAKLNNFIKHYFTVNTFLLYLF